MNEHVLTVTLLTQAIRELLETEFPIVHVVGEISNYKLHQSGHRYFTLKDEGAQIRCVIWRGRAVPYELGDGMQVRVRGRLTVYPLQGTYQIDCYSVVPAGIGDLYMAFEQLKRELAAAGYFDSTRKRPLPRFPLTIGVATSPTGAAIRDILTTLERRNPLITVVFRPTLVQGAEAAEDIARAIAELERYGCDVIIIGRGGGSIEDLWAFNTRTVADAIFHARVPIVSAVGHETDVTIADFVADLRAATPTAAAELCTPIRRDDLYHFLDDWSEQAMVSLLSFLDETLSHVEEFFSPALMRILLHRLERLALYQATTEATLKGAVERIVEGLEQKLHRYEQALHLLHPLQPLQRGFALLERDGMFLARTDSLKNGDRIRVHRLQEAATAHIVEVFSPSTIPSQHFPPQQ
ncbi:MAG: exodeoxyribonuclease VII large subunit [Bacteroidota bacterium]|nr:exodeoxyribonuclease VII large subunit [Candidatus Kapabacteria bacterium]MDW8074710.1 exodeoxyribonuclease VII large subunit [Bacteroidota bacterium]MDW8270814.1 exodeoxyribonuclease VII large subunit [Bacteroidota bacterium]